MIICRQVNFSDPAEEVAKTGKLKKKGGAVKEKTRKVLRFAKDKDKAQGAGKWAGEKWAKQSKLGKAAIIAVPSAAVLGTGAAIAAKKIKKNKKNK